MMTLNRNVRLGNDRTYSLIGFINPEKSENRGLILLSRWVIGSLINIEAILGEMFIEGYDGSEAQSFHNNEACCIG
jgi:hypothetical protein